MGSNCESRSKTDKKELFLVKRSWYKVDKKGNKT
jgi:hypothetical protein